MSIYRDEQAEIAHLEPPAPRFIPVGSSAKGLGPAHRWGSVRLDPNAERCARCGLTRWETSEGPLYRLALHGQVRMGAEPRCTRLFKKEVRR